jgi:hypothetical protein
VIRRRRLTWDVPVQNGGVMRVSWEGKWPPTEVQRRTFERLISVRRAPYDHERTGDFG